MDTVRLCVICEDTTLSTAESELVLLHGQAVCLPCISALRSDQHFRSHPDPGPGRSFRLPLTFRCSVHEAKAEAYCNTCDAVLCMGCMAEHDGHSSRNLQDAIEEVENTYNFVHFLAVYSMRIVTNNVEILQELRSAIEEEFTRTERAPENAILRSFATLSNVYADIIDLNPVLWGLSAKSNYHIIRKLPYDVPLQERGIHWGEWSGCSMHLYNIQTRCFLSQQMAPGFVFPLYCRSIFLPDGALFLCGGRKRLESHGMRKSWFIHLHDWSIIRGPTSLLGHANHSIGFFEGNIYVLGGCNHANQFTRECEVLNLAENQWTRLPDMIEVRDSVASVIDKRQRRIYAFGGRFRAQGCHESIECYHIRQQRWVMLELRLNYPIYMHGAVMLPFDTRVLIFGGLNQDDSKTGRALIINLATQIAEDISSMASVGCITDEPRIIGHNVIVSVFYGYASRQMNKLDLRTLTWTLF